MKVWGGVFTGASDPRMDAFGASLHIDKRLAPMDAAANRAHIEMLQYCGILSEAQAAPLLHALSHLPTEVEGPFEDVHTWVEAHCGEAGENLRIARSRNDLVATDLKLWCRQACVELAHGVLSVGQALLGRAQEHAATLMPGYTHLQRAQPVTVGHHLMAWQAMLERDLARLGSVFNEINATCPLGAGSLATTTWPIQPEWTARRLGFAGPFTNSMDAVSDRDFVLSLHYAMTTCMGHLSRLAEDLILWSTAEFGFASLPDAFTTGSSLMPQKKNPDPLELIRGRAAVTIGNFTGALALMKGLPLTYNRDLQEDKAPLFASFDILQAALGILSPCIGQMTVHTDNCRRALDDGILATDAADVLVREGCTFREAHHRIGAALRTGEALPDLQVDTILQEKQVPGGPGTTSAAVVAAQGRWQAAHAEWQIRHRKDRTAYEVTAAEAHR